MNSFSFIQNPRVINCTALFWGLTRGFSKTENLHPERKLEFQSSKNLQGSAYTVTVSWPMRIKIAVKLLISARIMRLSRGSWAYTATTFVL
jgi:hypothetical protein